MQHIRHIICCALLLGSAATALQAQDLESAYFTDDYKYRHEMNPAMGAEQTYISIPALGNVNTSIMGNFGLEAIIKKNPVAGGKKNVTFMHPALTDAEALADFHSGNNKIQTDLALSLFSAGWKGWGGYNTIDLRMRMFAGASVPYELFEFARNTGNKSYDIDGLSAKATAYMELGLGHSHQLNDKLRIGAKVKLLLGAGMAEVGTTRLTADLSQPNQWTISGQARADVYMKGFKFKEEVKEYKDGSTYRQVNDVDVDGGGIGGMGFGVDLGAVYDMKDLVEGLKLSAAVTDLGFINWKNHVSAANKASSFSFSGFHDIEVNDDNNRSLSNQWDDDYADQLTDFAHMEIEGEGSAKSTMLQATARLGGEYRMPFYDKLSAGLLLTHRFAGDYSWNEARLSANWQPLRWLNGNINGAYSNFGGSLGWMINIHPKVFNFFFGMDHTLGKTTSQGVPLAPKASVLIGMNVAW